MSDNIKVVVKVRPLISREIEDKLSYQWRVKNNTLYQLDQSGREYGSSFTFDKVYDEKTRTNDVYNDIAKPIVEAATAGINGTIFAYGQTSSGKTYTMSGTERAPGIIPLAVLNLFDIIKNKEDRDFLLRVSYIEIYNETIKDLLDVDNKEKIKIHETYQGGVKVDATEKVTSSPEEVLEVMRQGEANRQIGTTNMNEKSSRSHSIFQITIESREHTSGSGEGGCVNVSTLNLVDLAGSERAGQTGATGLRFKEGTHINKSLSALALVIKQLSEDPNKFANYRDSKLTRILQNSLGGNAKTSIICAVTPAAIEETISTLQFANRAKAIKNKPEVNAVTTNATMIQRLTKKLSKLQYQLESKKSLEQDNRLLQQKIESLQRQILNGFGAGISVDVSRSDRRKTWCAPRRATIDTLPSIEEDIAPTVHRFATPALKYNPAMLSDFRPVQATSQLPLPRVSEEGHITPPPREKKSVNFSDEIIELDSDDDESSRAHCSPYHKCYESSKTPPCVLREKAKEAEKNLQDIVELTERERIYTPSVVEVMEKLEANTVVIVKLQEEVNSLNTKCQDRDTEIKHLKDKITKAEDDIKTVNAQKEDLEKIYKEAETKLTDVEFSFETLRQKAKCREEELLSLLEEKRIDVPKNNNSKQLKAADKEINFMDLSKDISLVNSDNETSIINPNCDETSHLHELVGELQNQLSTKSNLAIELENKICAQDRKIKQLESETTKMQEMFDNIKEKLSTVESENTSLKTTIDHLNSTIKNQKDNFDAVNKDIESYTTLIQELQSKLNNVNSVPLNLDDHIIENMILSEENIIANNDNLRNIIHSLKSAIDARDQEISSLKSESRGNECDNSEGLEKETQLKKLLEEVEDLKQKIHEDSKKIVILTEEICNLTENNTTISQELTDSKAEYNKLEQKYQDEISEFNSYKQQQSKSLEILQKETAQKTEQLECLSETINTLNNHLLKKDNLLSSIEQDKAQFENVSKFQIVIEKLYNILTLLNGQTISESVPSEMGSLATQLIDGVSSLEVCVLELNTAKESAIANISDLNIKMEEKENKILEYKTKIESLLLDIKNITESHHELDAQNQKLINENTNIKKEIQEKEGQINELEEYKIEIETLKTKNQALSETICDIKGELSNKQIEMDTLQAEYTARFETIRQDIDIVRDSYEKLEEKNIGLTTNMETLTFELENKQKECEDLQEKVLKYSSQLDMFNQNLAEKDSGFVSLQQKESVLVAEVERLNALLNESEHSFESLKKELESQNALYISNTDKIHKILANKHKEISDQLLYNSEMTLQEKYTEIIRHAVIVAENYVRNEEMLRIILDKATKLTDSFGIDSSFIDEEEHFESFNDIPHLLDKIAVHFDVLTQKLSESVDIQNRQLEDALAEAKTQIQDLTTNNLKLTTDLSQLQVKSELEIVEINEFKNENSSLKKNLYECNALLKTLQQEVAQKAGEINEMEINMRKFKEEFINLDKELRQRIIKLESENSDLNRQILEFKEGNGITVNDSVPSFTELQNITSSIRKSISNVLEEPAKNKPPSLITLCCSQIIDVLTLNQKENGLTPITSSESLMNSSKEALVFTEKEFKIVQDENNKLKHNLEVLKHANLRLIQEQEEIRHEIKLLIEPSIDLQKKIAKHKTNLSTLTATTYAENKALQSQVKVLQHHHTRFHNVCQKDIPQFKKQLMELYSVLKNESQFKRYSLPDVLDKNTTTSTFKNDSTLDGDLLMLDTNVTLATCNDNTLVGHDQTCFEMTQIDLSTNNVTVMDIEPSVQNHIDILVRDNQKMNDNIAILEEENEKLKEIIDQLKMESAYSIPKHVNENLVQEPKSESECSHEMMRKIDKLAEELSTIKKQKEEIVEKYNNLLLEIPSAETLVRKLSTLEKEHNTKLAEITNLTNVISKKNRDLKQLQEENDTLSTQVMENISEADDLKKELDVLKEKLADKCNQLEQESEVKINAESCPQCLAKEKLLNKLVTETETANTQNDSDTSVRYNKICTLQNELLASKEQCKKITEEFATIKNHLERSNLSITHDMDDSMGESNIFTFTKDFEVVNTSTSNYGTNMPKILEEKSSDIYALDKADCLNYYVELTGAEKENLNHDIKIIDVMKKLYHDLIVKHGNEVDNLLNKLKDYEELQQNLHSQIHQISTEYNDKRREIETVTNTISTIKHSISTINDSLNSNLEPDSNTEFVVKFKEDILKVLDVQFDLKSMNVFETLMENMVSKHQNDLDKSMDQYNELKKHMESLMSELATLNESLKEMKSHLTVTENDYNLLKAQKERVHEISNAVTLDIIKKEKELNDTISKGCQLLLENNIMEHNDIDLTEPAIKNITILFEKLVSQHKAQNSTQTTELNKEIENLALEIKNSKVLLDDKELELNMTKQKYENEHKINESVTLDLIHKDKELKKLQSVNDEQNKALEKMKNDHDNNIALMNNLKQEIEILKEVISKKEIVTKNLENELSSIKSSKNPVDALSEKAHNLEIEVKSLKAANDIILKEKHDLDTNLKTAAETILVNNLELDNLKQEVHELKNSIKESKFIFDDMKSEMDEMTKRMKDTEGKQNMEIIDKYKDLEKKYEDKCKDCSRLEMNIKTHEKTVEIQSSMVKRLQKQKEEDCKKIEELSNKCTTLQQDYDTLQATLISTKEELTNLQQIKDTLEARISLLEGEQEADRGRGSLEKGQLARRRRQSLHDSQRTFSEDRGDEHTKLEQLFAARAAPDDLFMDVDSAGSTPARNSSASSRKHDSFGTRLEHSDKEDEGRPSSVLAARRRRQSAHDLRRSVLPTPTGSPSARQLIDELNSSPQGDHLDVNEMSKLKSTLQSCQQELEELKERYKELDEECETCAEYLQERDKQCTQLMKEKRALETTVAELTKSLEKFDPNATRNARTYASVAVNTDEDWANLHSVVVDRMSFDAEVEKNKRLTRAIEELRLKNRELKAALASAQRAMEKRANRDEDSVARELEQTRQQLRATRHSLEELQHKYQTLDDECETCSEYLKERDEQCRRLQEKLEELVSSKQKLGTHTAPRTAGVDVSTETCEDLLSYQVERDGSSKKPAEDVQRLSKIVEKLSREKIALQQQLQAPMAPTYVAMGSAIVQASYTNQQLTDIMKENQKLKKINAKLIAICKKRGKDQTEARENVDFNVQG
ncbi:hypothetical protein JYU34_009343 [Plutella xylostella]|uniref:Kinesin motor domain-containing protein n=1 Tax=Plutella xylostella TaxID=51655 RepID=A0ABQ7QK46_PLUXY|nr:hypothetical protein JYU34_009343 [Plutella xylostella]